MSAVNSVKLKANCNAVSSGSLINQSVSNSSIVEKATPNITTINNNNFNNGTNLNQSSSVKSESPVTPSDNLSDVQKVLKQEQELQKQLYSGSNNAPGWLRVNHNNKVIYISPSGIGLASLKQVKDYLLTRGTCKCGLPFPLRVELFFNFNTEVPTVPLKTPIDSIKFDPTCQHRKKLTTNNNQQNGKGNFKSGIESFDGCYVRGKKVFGMRTYTNGIFIGDFDDDEMRKKGKYEFDNGDSYCGSFLNGQFHGFGEYHWRTCELSYVGFWKDNCRHGIGKLTVAGAQCLTHFNRNIKNGPGIVWARNGSIYLSKCMFVNDEFKDCKRIDVNHESIEFVRRLFNLQCELAYGLAQFASCIAYLEDKFASSAVDVYPFHLSWFELSVQHEAIWDFVKAFNADKKQEFESISQLIREHKNTFEECYRKYARISQKFLGRLESQSNEMTRVGLWRFFRDLGIYRKGPLYSTQAILDDAEKEFNILTINSHDPFEVVSIANFLHYILYIVLHINRHHTFVLSCAINQRSKIFGLFATMLVIFMREFMPATMQQQEHEAINYGNLTKLIQEDKTFFVNFINIIGGVREHKLTIRDVFRVVEQWRGSRKLILGNDDSGRQPQQSTSQSSQQLPAKKLIRPQKRSGECLLPSYVTSKIISQSSTTRSSNNSVMIVNSSSSNTLATNSIQPTQIMQSKSTFQQQQPQYVQHETQPNGNVVMRIISKESAESAMMDDSKLPPWKKNSMQNQKQQQQQQMSSGIPIFQINGQMIAVDQQNQQFGGQQIQIIEQKTDGGEQKTIIRRRPTFKEDPTGYLNQQTALLHNTITTLHSPDGTTTITSPADNNAELRTQRQQFIQQIVKAAPPGNQVTTIGGQTVTHMSNGIVQIQNCDIKQQQTQPNKPLVIQEQIIQQNKFIRTNPKGRPPKNAATIAKRLVAMSQESPVSSSTSVSIGSPVSGGNVMKITKANTPDITSSSHADVTETMQVQSSYDATEIVKFARNSTTQELIRTSMTQMVAGKTTNTSTTTAIRKQQPPQMAMMKKPQIVTQVKTQCANPTQQTNLASPGGQQIVMTSNGQQFIVMPQPQQSQPTQNIMLNNNAIVQFQNSSPKLLQSPQNSGNIIIQTNPLTGQNFIVNQQPLVLQNGQILTTNNGNLIASPKGNILTVTSGNSGNGGKTIISGNNQLTSQMLGQQTVLLPNNGTTVMPQSTIIHDPSSFMASNAMQQQQQKIIVQNPVVGEKKKGRKRKIPLTDNSQQQNQQHQNLQPVTISQVQQPNMIQMASPQSFQLSPNILVNKFPNQQAGAQQIILQNGQTIIQQPVQFQSAPIMALSPDGQLVQIQNPSFNNIITTPQGMMIRQAQAPTQTAPQKTIITNNGQQYIVQGGQFQLPTFTNSPMGFVVQQPNQQIINSIPQIITQPQIITHSNAQSPTTTVLTQQQASQFFTTTQNEAKRKIVATPKNTTQMQSSQSQKYFPAHHQQRTTTMYTTTTSTKNAIPIVTTQEVIEEPEEMEPEENCEELEMEEGEENCEEMEPEELELSFEEDYKPDMIEELHHGTSQQILHGSAFMNDGGQFGIMNIDDIKIEMDEINDLNEYLNAIDEEDNRMTQMSLQQFGNSPPDTTTHSPRSPNNGDMLMHGSEKSNGSSEGNNNMVSSSEADSNVVSPECHQIIDSVQSPSPHHNHYQSHNIQHFSQQNSSFSQQQSPQYHSGSSQPVFKLPMEPRSNIKSPPSSNIFDTCNRSPLMRPDSHESSENPFRESSEEKDESEDVPKKSDFDLLKESPPVNTIKPNAIDNMVKAEDPPCPISPVAVEQQKQEIISPQKEESNFKVGDLIWGVTRGCDAWPGKIVNGPDDEQEPTSSNCVWVKWFGGRQSIEMVQCSTLKSLSEGLEAHHAARKETRTGRKLNSHLERAIQKAMAELDKQSDEATKAPNSTLSTTTAVKSGKGNNEKKSMNTSQKSTKSRMIKIAPAPSENTKK